MSVEIETALEVVEVEIAGLKELGLTLKKSSHQIHQAFINAVELCHNVKGRVIVTGMGKSGHVARKIAATMASTGTRASYVHPGEASHGDLGMISEDDVVIALSNSGNTPELGDIIGYTSRFNIPLISITAGSNSNLANAASQLLLVPKSKEACDATKAPTTSTTIMMALGDALAVAVLRNKGFSAEDFHVFHPGGKLGAALKRVTDLMHHIDMPLCRPEESMSVAIQEISTRGFGCVGVVDSDNILVGMVTDGDLRRHIGGDVERTKVKDIMTCNPRTVNEKGLAAEALAMLSEFKITALFIVDDKGKPTGILHVHDCLSEGVV